jgi:hypothetical protein
VFYPGHFFKGGVIISLHLYAKKMSDRCAGVCSELALMVFK